MKTKHDYELARMSLIVAAIWILAITKAIIVFSHK